MNIEILLFLIAQFFSINNSYQTFKENTEKELILKGRLIDFDATNNPLGIQFIYTPFCCKDQKSETVFF